MKREIITLSASPRNPDVALVLGELQNVEPRQRSMTLFAWAAAYLRGEASAPQVVPDDAIEADDFADLISGL